jgi:hypothetical protein
MSKLMGEQTVVPVHIVREPCPLLVCNQHANRNMGYLGICRFRPANRKTQCRNPLKLQSATGIVSQMHFVSALFDLRTDFSPVNARNRHDLVVQSLVSGV